MWKTRWRRCNSISTDSHCQSHSHNWDATRTTVNIIKINISMAFGSFKPLSLRISNIFCWIVARAVFCICFGVRLHCQWFAHLHIPSNARPTLATVQLRFFVVVSQFELTKLNKTMQKMANGAIPLMNMHIHFYGRDFAFSAYRMPLRNVTIDINFDMMRNCNVFIVQMRLGCHSARAFRFGLGICCCSPRQMIIVHEEQICPDPCARFNWQLFASAVVHVTSPRLTFLLGCWINDY